MVTIQDGRRLFGDLEAIDCQRNIVLKNSIEEIPYKNLSKINFKIKKHIKQIYNNDEENPYFDLKHLDNDKRTEFNKKFQKNVFYHNGVVIPGKVIKSVKVQKGELQRNLLASEQEAQQAKE